MAQAHEQHPSEGVGDSAGGGGVQLTPLATEKAESGQLPAFSVEKDIASVLRFDSYMRYKRPTIAEFFCSHMDEAERIEFLKAGYNMEVFSELIADKKRLGYIARNVGFTMWEGSYLSRSSESIFTWSEIQRRISDMIDKGEYLDAEEARRSRQLTLFGDALQTSEKPSADDLSAASPRPIAAILSDGSDRQNSTLRICAFFRRDKPTAENAAFLRKEYGKFGKGYVVDGERFAAWFDESGVRIAQGDTAIESESSAFISWEQAALGIRQLLDSGEYMPRSDLDRVDRNEQREIAEAIWHLDKDCEGISLIDRPGGFRGYAEESAYLAGQLSDRAQLAVYRDRVADLVERYERDRDILRFHYHRPRELLDRMDGLLRERLDFTSDKESRGSISHFVTQDEMDAFIVGDDRHISIIKKISKKPKTLKCFAKTDCII